MIAEGFLGWFIVIFFCAMASIGICFFYINRQDIKDLFKTK